jgi:hypothetical protein
MAINLFSWLFPEASKAAPSPPDDPALEKSLDCAYAMIDPRLKALGGDGRQRFREAVVEALAFCRSALDKISPILDASKANWRASAQLRALFSSAEDLQAALSRSPELQDFTEKHPSAPFYFAVLGTRMSIRDGFGTVLSEDGQLRRDAAVREAIFSPPKFFLPCPTQVAFDEACIHGLFCQLCRETRQAIDSRRAHIADLQAEIRSLKNALLLRQRIGADEDPAGRMRIEQDLQERKARLAALRLPNLDEEMAQAAELLARPQALMPAAEKLVRIDRTNRLVQGEAPGEAVHFWEFSVHAPAEKHGVILRIAAPADELLSRRTLADNLARLYP